MSLIGALNVGQTALAVQQAALQVTGNNIANAGNADYTRETASISPEADQKIGTVFVGTGVNITGISRQIDDALEARLRTSISDSQSADTTAQYLDRVQAVFNELSSDDISTQMSTFFNSWSNLANNPQDQGLRGVVLQDGASVAQSLASTRNSFSGIENDADSQIKSLANNANSLAQQIAGLNGQISTAEAGAGAQSNALRDQRDAAIKQLSQLVNVTAVDTGKGSVNILVGSEPLVLGTTNRGITTKIDPASTTNALELTFEADGGTMNVTSGQIGGLIDSREKINDVINQLDTLTSNVIYEVNNLHASGQGLQGYSQITASNAVKDTSLALNDPKAGLPATATNGSFVVHLKQKSTGLETSTLVKIDLDGVNNNDTTLTSLANNLNSISGLTAKIVGGKLQIATTSADTSVSFSQDSSGVLATLGVNSFFTGTSAKDIAVNQALVDDPSLLAASKNGEAGDNQTALAMGALESKAIASLNGASLKDNYQAMVNGLAVGVQNAKTNSDAAKAVNETLSAQREALSGVSQDEEAINLVRQQRAFQGAARFISAIDDMMKTLLAIT